MVAAEEAGRSTHRPDTRMLMPAARSRGEAVRDGWVRFQLSDGNYRKLANTPDLAAIVTVDREAGRILSVKFSGRQ